MTGQSTENGAVLDAAVLAVVDLESRESDPSVEQYARAVLAAVKGGIAAQALREAGEASFMDWVPVFYEGESDEWINEKVRRWLNHRADRITPPERTGDGEGQD